MKYEEFVQCIRPRFSQTYAVVIKQASKEMWRKFIKFLIVRQYLSSFSSDQTDECKEVDFEYISRYFDGYEQYWPSMIIDYKQLRLECFIEKETEIVLWFNDRLDQELNQEKFSQIKQLMDELAKEFATELYFMNEDAANRYKLFALQPDGNVKNFDLSDYSQMKDEDY